ncbi:MAG: DUF6455 family protein [Sinimarinibacterium sp.]|jgi:hypothetical protein
MNTNDPMLVFELLTVGATLLMFGSEAIGQLAPAIRDGLSKYRSNKIAFATIKTLRLQRLLRRSGLSAKLLRQRSSYQEVSNAIRLCAECKHSSQCDETWERSDSVDEFEFCPNRELLRRTQDA